MEYQIILSKRGKEIYKGGNIEVMKPMLISFSADTERKAESKFHKFITQNTGSAQLDNYTFEKKKEVSKCSH